MGELPGAAVLFDVPVEQPGHARARRSPGRRPAGGRRRPPARGRGGSSPPRPPDAARPSPTARSGRSRRRSAPPATDPPRPAAPAPTRAGRCRSLPRASTATETTGSATDGRFQDQRRVRRAQGRARRGRPSARPRRRCPPPPPRPRSVVPVGLHPQDPADPLGAAARRVAHRVALAQGARVDPQIGQAPARGGRHLEGQRRERLRRVGAPAPAPTPSARAAHRRHVGGRRQVGHHRVQQRLDPAVAVGRSAQHHHGVPAAGSAPAGRGPGSARSAPMSRRTPPARPGAVPPPPPRAAAGAGAPPRRSASGTGPRSYVSGSSCQSSDAHARAGRRRR